MHFSVTCLLNIRLGQYNTSTASLQKGETPCKEYPAHDTKQSDGETPVVLELFMNAEYPFIAIAPTSTLSRIGNTW